MKIIHENQSCFPKIRKKSQMSPPKIRVGPKSRVGKVSGNKTFFLLICI